MAQQRNYTYNQKQKDRTLRYLKTQSSIVMHLPEEQKAHYREMAEARNMSIKSFFLESADYIIKHNIDLNGKKKKP